MFAENLKTIRKSKGMTQEELAIRLRVVRQTVSKWEKGLSVPDSDMLVKISEIFEVSVSELLGTRIDNEINQNEIAEQLSRINEQLAIKNKRNKMILKVVIGIIITIIVANLLLVTFSLTTYNSVEDSVVVEQEVVNIYPRLELS